MFQRQTQCKEISERKHDGALTCSTQLDGLTQTEQMLIARALPIISIYIKPGGQRGYSGHCVNLPQDVTNHANALPRYPKDVSVVLVKMKGTNNTFKDVRVRRKRVQHALNWLIANNPCYKMLDINFDALAILPEDGIPDDFMSLHTTEQENENDTCHYDQGPCVNDEDLVYNEQTQMTSFLPVPEKEAKEINIMQQQLETATMEWPSVDEQPLNEFNTPYLATMAFPTPFPDGKGDPTNPSLLRDVSFSEKIKHLIKYAERTGDNWTYHFATHPRFTYWALNMMQRTRTLGQCQIFLKQNPDEAHLNFDELKEIAESGDPAHLMAKMSHYVANISGTNAYWHKAKEDLKAIINHVGAPTLFFTFSAADMHWPDLYDLFGSSSSKERRDNIINNPHLADCFFTEGLESFMTHWLYNTLDADWHWFRYEYQTSRGSIHCHGTAKLKDDPGLCKLTERALQGFLAQKKLDKGLITTNDNELYHLIEEGKKTAETVCKYADWL